MDRGDTWRRQSVLSALRRVTARGPRPFSESPLPPLPALPGGRLYRFLVSDDPEPPAEIDVVATDLDDDMIRLVFRAGHFPSTLQELLDILDGEAGAASGLDEPRSFLVADGGQLPQTLDVERHFRWVVTRSRANNVDILVSAGAVSPLSGSADPGQVFLQVMAWDSRGHFNFYERLSVNAWSHAGGSWDALDPKTRGFGPFDSHVNGGPVMKELKEPWPNWESMDASIRGNIAADDPLASDPLFDTLKGAEDLETLVVRPGIERWTKSRLQVVTQTGVLRDAPAALRHLLETTTINLVASPDRALLSRPGMDLPEAAQPIGQPLVVPLELFLNVDLLLKGRLLTGDSARLPAALTRKPTILAQHYQAAVDELDVALVGQSRSTGRSLRIPGDGFFALIAPEPAYEDTAVVRRLVRMGVISDRLVCCAAMVDFPNPVFSAARSALLAAVPAELQLAGGADAVSELLAAGLGAGDGAAAAEFAELWSLGPTAFRSALIERLNAYVERVQARLAEPDGVLDLMRLVLSRRQEFRQLRLSEFSLTVPVGVGDPPALVMTEAGTVQPRVSH